MIRNSILIWITFLAAIAALLALVMLVILLWPPDVFQALLLATLIAMPAIAFVSSIERQRRRVSPVNLSVEDIIGMSDEELQNHRLDAMADYQRRLELRELRLARRIRTYQLKNDQAVDLLEANPSDEELSHLVGNDHRLLDLIEQESRLVFDRIRANRYGAEEGVNIELVVADTRAFVEKIAKLYRPDATDILLHTEIELVAKSFSNASLHLLMVVDNLPFNLKSYNTAKIYRQVRLGASYYGTYKAFRPYLEHGLNALQVTRLALGMNPVAAGATWLAGKAAARGARSVGERILQRTALQLVNDFVRVIGFEAAIVYGGGFQHRDANWVFAVELINLEIARGEDFAGRDAALTYLCNLSLRNEFDRFHLLRSLSRRQHIDLSELRSHIMMTKNERDHVATELLRHCLVSEVRMEDRPIRKWRLSVEKLLDVEFPADRGGPSGGRKPSRWRRLKKRLKKNSKVSS